MWKWLVSKWDALLYQHMLNVAVESTLTAIEHIQNERITYSCVAIMGSGAPLWLAIAYKQHSRARSLETGFRDYDLGSWFNLSQLEQRQIRLQKLANFLDDLPQIVRNKRKYT